jgi:hypothetical protein
MSVQGGLAKPTRAHLAARRNAEFGAIASSKLPACTTVGKEVANTVVAVASESK